MRWVKVFWIVTIGVLGRLVPHVPNVTPLTGLSLFVGASLPRPIALLILMFTLFISDLLLAFVFGYPAIGYFTLFTYTGFIGIAFIGSRFKCTRGNFPFYVLGVSFSFWVWTNFGVWLTGDLYPKTVEGLGICYYMALPFLRNALVGDLIWVSVIFGFARVAEFGRRAGFRFQ